MKLVSVVVPLYRSEAFIESTLQSVLKQTYQSFEIIVVDDGSPDKSAEVVRAIGDRRIRVFSRHNTGPCRSRNFGIAQARGDFVAFLDHDDAWLPTKLEKHVEHLSRVPDVGVSYGPSEFMDVDGTPLGIYQIPRLTDIDARQVLCRNPIGNGSVPVIRRELLEAVKFYDECDGQTEVMYFDERCRGWEDSELWFRMIYTTQWRFEGIPDCLTLYRLTPGGITSEADKKQACMERGLERLGRYAPEFLAQHGNAARAYHLRMLARRLVYSNDAVGAVRFVNSALRAHPGIILEEPKRTLLTIGAAYCQRVMPKRLFRRLESVGLDLMGKSQMKQARRDAGDSQAAGNS